MLLLLLLLPMNLVAKTMSSSLKWLRKCGAGILDLRRSHSSSSSSSSVKLTISHRVMTRYKSSSLKWLRKCGAVIMCLRKCVAGILDLRWSHTCSSSSSSSTYITVPVIQKLGYRFNTWFNIIGVSNIFCMAFDGDWF